MYRCCMFSGIVCMIVLDMIFFLNLNIWLSSSLIVVIKVGVLVSVLVKFVVNVMVMVFGFCKVVGYEFFVVRVSMFDVNCYFDLERVWLIFDVLRYEILDMVDIGMMGSRSVLLIGVVMLNLVFDMMKLCEDRVML